VRYFDLVKTKYGAFQIQATTRGVAGIQFPGRFKKVHGNPPPKAIQHLFQAARQAIRHMLCGRKNVEHRIPIDWRFANRFQKKVLRRLRRVPPGRVATYGELAKACGHPNAARAVGTALKWNAVPMLIPCHRVIRTDQTLGEFQSGRTWKKRLLNLEKNSVPNK
jgi:O-6-methylguanine DNA methyltransferase